MKPIGSLTEELLKTQLLSSHSEIFNSNDSFFLSMLKIEFSDLTTAYIIDWIPEQEENFYTVLINNTHIAQFEVPHNRTSYKLISSKPIREYRRKLKKTDQIKLMVALILSEQDLLG